MSISAELIKKIKELNSHYESADAEVGLFDCDNSGVIFSSLQPKERAELMNLFRPLNWFQSEKRLNLKKIERQCKQKISEIYNV